MLQRPDIVVIDDQFLDAHLSDHIKPAGSGDVINLRQQRHQAASGRFTSGLVIDDLGIRHGRIGVGGKPIVFPHLRISYGDHAALHGLHRRVHGLHIEDAGRTAIDGRMSRLGTLDQNEPAQHFDGMLEDASGQGDRSGRSRNLS